MRRKNKTSLEKEDKVICLWKAGRLIKQIMFECSISKAVIYQILHRNDIQPSRINHFSKGKQYDLFERD